MELKRIRLQAGLKQEEVAKVINTTGTVYARYERGERQPSIDTLIQLSQFYGVTIDYLVGNKDTPLSSFSKYELDLITASRQADDRAREDALTMLLSHPKEKKKENYA